MRLRRQYQKRAKEATKQSAKAAGKTAAATEKLTARAAGFVKRHPVGCLLALACVLVIVLLQSCSSSLVSIGNAGAGALGATTYPSADEAILGAAVFPAAFALCFVASFARFWYCLLSRCFCQYRVK